MKNPFGKQKDYNIIKKSGLFDVHYYCSRYDDVRHAEADPIEHYLKFGWVEGKNPSQEFDSNYYLATYPDVAKSGMNPLLHYVLYGKAEGRLVKNTDTLIIPEASSNNNQYRPSIGEIDSPDLAPIHFFLVDHSESRINMITDTISSTSLFGGVATSMIFCTLLANKLGCPLRIITRHDEPQGANYYRLLENNQINTQHPVEFVYSDYLDDRVKLPISSGDYFVTTSWWTTYSLLKSIKPDKVTYLIQEDERSFFPYGDVHFLCSKVLSNDHLHFLVNSELLYNYLLADGFENFKTNAQWFEPSFDPSLFFREKTARTKKNFFFYARPGNPRNLYYLGCRVLVKALEQRVLTPDEWDIHFVGQELMPVKLTEDCSPIIHTNLQWEQYAGLIRKMDVGLSLIYSPHPSYPPLDLATSGAVVVTNRFANKQTLDNYSKNIICCDLDETSLLDGIIKALKWLQDEETILKNYEDNCILRDWGQSFQKILQDFSFEQ